MGWRRLSKFFPLLFLFVAAVSFGFVKNKQPDVLGMTTTIFYIHPDFLKLSPGQTSDTQFCAERHDGTNRYQVYSYWEVLKPEAGTFIDYPGGQAKCVKFKAGPTEGDYYEAIKAICADNAYPDCQGKEARASVKIYSPTDGSYCGDDHCKGGYGEDCDNCPQDCGQCPPEGPVCGNNTCESGEDCDNCRSDCGQCPTAYCGDGICNNGETCSTCSKDCGQCPTTEPACGNNVCESGETCTSCSKDCGACPSPSSANYCEGYFIAEGDPVYKCVKDTLGADFAYFNIRENGPDCKNESLWHELADKAAKACFEVSGPVYYAEPPPEVTTCLREALGEERYRALVKGTIQPTAEDITAFKSCEARTRDVIYYAPGPLDEKTKACLILAVGEKRFNEISKGAMPTPDEMEKGSKCFGAQTTVAAAAPAYELPKEVKDCLLKVFGKEKFEKLRTGRIEPTAEEIKKGKACFEKINTVQQQILPPPPEKVPLLGEVKEMKIEAVKTEFRRVTWRHRQPRIVFTGTALPNTTVNIYIFSTPVVLSVRADANGVWTYYLEDPLDPGEHTAYVVTRQEDGTEVRSALYSFSVAAAAPGETGSLLVEGATPSLLREYLGQVALIVGGATLVLLTLLWIRHRRTTRVPPAAIA